LSDTDDLRKQVREMAHLSILSGRISEIQERNLKIYPLVYFNGVTSVRIEYDLLQTTLSPDGPVASNSKVSYFLSLDEKTPNFNMERRFDSLLQSVHNLLWNDIIVNVYFNDKIVFTNERR
jgi:hypothetical protein